MGRMMGMALTVWLLAACGGGGEQAFVPDPPAVVSTKTFPLRSAYETITGRHIAANLVGNDNNAGASTTESYMVNGQTYYRTLDVGWRGTITVARRPASVVTVLGTSAYAVDYNIQLSRNRDGKAHLDAVTIFFDATARPLAVVSLNNYLAVWKTPVDGLPELGKVGASGGTAMADVCWQPQSASLTALACVSEDTQNIGVSSWVFRPDTADTGVLTYTYKSMVSGTSDGAATVAEVGIRIDDSGAYRGVVYRLVEGPFVLKMTGL